MYALGYVIGCAIFWAIFLSGPAALTVWLYRRQRPRHVARHARPIAPIKPIVRDPATGLFV